MPAGVPAAAVAGLSTAIGNIAASEEMKQRIADMGLELRYMDAAEYAQYWDSEIERLEKLTAALPQ